ncbi:DUF3895 domain-containing protein [Paenibacillus sp. Leaf72]|uniref:DUF3895 domain-containing protein n=1 Tax=Paenibacillus sp. Leaf72 TaxID=1736234 RepID=UPI0006F225C9|nr:DUF3895 domain-containing protein [Paenibacillus sp. Leaf72]KQN96912.1 hypothetical protein ASF12_22855 [Paenibacillus sp. Leaf72]
MNDYMQMDLFNEGYEPDSTRPHRSSVKINALAGHKIHLDFEYGEWIDAYLQEGITSAREMTDRLVVELSKKEIEVQFFITGKPHLYIPVCVYLDGLVRKEKLEYLFGTEVDRKYQLRSRTTTW